MFKRDDPHACDMVIDAFKRYFDSGRLSIRVTFDGSILALLEPFKLCEP